MDSDSDSDSSSSEDDEESDNIFKSKSALYVFDVKNTDTTLPFDDDGDDDNSDNNLNEIKLLKVIPLDFVAICICHPDTYLNKIVIGSKRGEVFLYNIR